LRTSRFKFVEPPRGQVRHMRHLAFSDPKRGDRLDRRLRRQAARYERLKSRDRWRRTVRLLREYNYWRGVATAIGGRRELAAWLQDAPMSPAVAADAPFVDLAALPPVETLDQVLEQGNHTGIRIGLGGIEVLALPPQPGAEPLRRESLYCAWRERAQQQFVPPLALHLIQAGTDLTAWRRESLLWPSSSPTST
jgi:hypothetical protein